jgi:hypothetical protein
MARTSIVGVATALIVGITRLACGSPTKVSPCRVDFADGGCGYYEFPYCVRDDNAAVGYCGARGGTLVEWDAGSCVPLGSPFGCA